MTRMLLGLAYLAGAGIWLLSSLLLNALRCDDTCHALSGAGWGNVADSWQWRAILLSGVIGALAALAAVMLAVVRRAAPAVAAVVVQSVAMGYAISLASTSGRFSGGNVLLLVAALIAATGLALALLSRRRPVTIDS
jgi:hypothetical protein